MDIKQIQALWKAHTELMHGSTTASSSSSLQLPLIQD